MKKNRMIAWTLATSMLVSSLSTGSFAQEIDSSADLSVDEVVVTSDEAEVISDDVVSAAAVDVSDEDEAGELVPMAVGDYITGYYNNKNFEVKDNGDGTVNLRTTTNTAGKYHDNEYNVGYYARPISADKDFAFSGKVTVNDFTTNTYQHQKAFGMMLANDKAYTSGKTFKHVAAYITGAASTDVVNCVARTARDESGERKVIETLDENFSVRGGDTFDFSMQKAGNAVKFTVDGKTSTYLVDDGYFSGEIYPMFFVGRSADTTISDIKFEEKDSITAIELTSAPDMKDCYTSAKLDTTGMVVTGTFANGTKRVLTEDEYILTGFDSSKLGTTTVTVSAGKGKATFDISVRNIEVTDVKIVQKPYKDEFHYGTKFKTDGLLVDVKLEDGSVTQYKHNSKEADDSLSLVYYIDGVEYKSGDIIPKSLQGTKTVKVFRKDTDSVTGGNICGEYTIEVSQGNLDRIEVYRRPDVRDYYYGNEFDPTGMVIAAFYKDDEGNESYDFLTSNEYTISGYNPNSTVYGTQTITVTSTFNTALKTTFEVNFIKSVELSVGISKYPRMTFAVGEAFDSKGLEVKVDMNDGTSKIVKEGEYYDIDLSQYDNSKPGETTVIIQPKNDFAPIKLAITIEEKKEHLWRSIVFGASADAVGAGSEPSKITVTPAGKYGTVDSDAVINVRSWTGAGKVATDQDGIAYYYTRIDGSKNVTLTADMEILGYMENYFENSYDIYDNFTPDSGRSGQEGVGLMLRDVIPLKADKSRGYGDDNGTTIFVHEAMLDDEGEPIGNPSNSAFASNMAACSAMSPNAFPSDVKASSYDKSRTANRITLIMRTGVDNYPKAGANADKSWYASLTDTVPKAGEKYRLTLQKANGGVRLECYDYQTGKTTDYYQDTEDLATLQNRDDCYIGFFAARWGDANFTNVELYETDPATDPIYPVPTKTLKNPSVAVQSVTYTSEKNYNLVLKPNHDSGGYVIIKQNDKTIYSNAELTRKGTTYPIELVPDSVNRFTVVYSPNPDPEIKSTADVVLNFTVTHKSNYDKKAKFLYASPTGTPAGDGTKENPLDIYSAIGFIEFGQTILLMEGTYKLDEVVDIKITNFGAQSDGLGKAMIADPEATTRPLLDFSAVSAGEGFILTGNYWTLKGFDITAPSPNMKGFSLGGSHCTLEDIKTYACGATGLQVSRTYSTNDFSLWPSYNLVKNCESYNSQDPARQNADGFGCKLTVGVGNVFDGCVSHHNSDDGWDLYTKLGTGAIGPVKLQNCISYRQGIELLADGSEKEYGTNTGHNGFKMGGENISVKHYIKDSISFENLAHGIDSNTNPAMKIRNVVCFNNPENFYLTSKAAEKIYDYDIKGAVSYKTENYTNKSTDAIGSLNRDTEFKNHSETEIKNATNYIILGGEDKAGKSENLVTGEIIGDDFFVSVNSSDMVKNGFVAQDADGNFIRNGFLVLTNNILSADDYDEPVETTEPVTSVTEPTTSSGGNSSSGGSNGGGGGGSSSSSKDKGGKASTITSTVIDEKEDPGNEDPGPKGPKPSTGSSFVTASGITIAPPVNRTTPKSFNDIAGRDWAKASIDKLSSLGVLNGVALGKFDPDASSKRADFIIMLDKILGISGYATDNFSDVPSNAYYANYVGIAKQVGITSGYSDGTFAPEKSISRQDMMVLVAKALELCGQDISADVSVLDKYADADSIADYAKPYVAYLVSTGLVSGTGNNIEPTANMTRAQMAVLMSNFYDEVLAIAESKAAEADEEVAEEEEAEEETDESSEEESEEESVEEVTEA